MTMRGAAMSVVRRLRDAGHTGLFAGGCVRDARMGKRPKDYDVATDAPPDRVVALFRRTRKVGIQFGVVLVGVGRHWIEVATFRSDGDYRDGRHPEGVRFTDAREDALRRDFTINGMFYDPIRREVIDHVGGGADLDARLVRAIGKPRQRFAEDHLRMLRAVRFAARFDFEIESSTRAAIRAHAAEIRKISAERIRMELELILPQSGRATAFGMLRDLGLLRHLWCGADELLPHAESIEAHLAALPAETGFEPAMAALLHPLPVDRVAACCRNLAVSNRTAKTVVWLVEHLGDLMEPDALTLADLKLLMARPAFEDLLALLAARLRATGRPATAHRRIVARVARIPPDEVAPPPLITGHDLAKLRLPKGPRYKRILERVYYAQLGGELSGRAAARKLAARLANEG